MQGKTINGFTLQRLLGVGGMAEVWYAENNIGMKAAVKIISEKLSHDDLMQERFLNEAKVMVMLDHPNIRKVYGFDQIDGRPAIIMEYLDGSDLKARMKSGQCFTQEELVKWWNQLVDALNYTHAQNIVHRDIKPSNIFVDQHGNVKLLDFGIAKVAETTTGTQTGSTLGTRIYMSPEQVRDPKRVGPPSDVYSLAVSFVHLLTGKAPYDSTTDSDYDIQESIVRKPVDLSKVPEAWRGFLAPYLAKDSAQRPSLRPFEMMTPSVSTQPVEPDDEGTIVNNTPKKNEPKKIESQNPEPKKEEPKAVVKSEPKDGNKPKSKKGLWIGLGIAAVVSALVLCFFSNSENTPNESIDFILLQDVSGSMLACDLKPDRLEASKEVIAHFMENHHNDRFGLVAFAGESSVQQPLNSDHAVVLDSLKTLKSGMITDGTAIGDGLEAAINCLKESDATSKVIILLTDGINNCGSIGPNTAAEMAEPYGIRIYTIGIGAYGTAPYPVQTMHGIQFQMMEVEIDEQLLQNIANNTGGKYFRANSNQKLNEIFDEIDLLECSNHYSEPQGNINENNADSLSIIQMENEEMIIRVSTKSLLSVGEKFQISFEANADGRCFTAPNFEGFTVVGGPFHVSNGTSATYTYALRADKEGCFTIGPASLIVDGMELKSEPYCITVVSDANNPDASGGEINDQDLFLKVIPSNETVCVGEPVELTYKLYTRHQVSGLSISQLPYFEGFRIKDKSDDNGDLHQETETINGIEYTTFVIKKVELTPLKVGEITIEPMRVECVCQIKVAKQRTSQNSGDPWAAFFNDPFLQPAIIMFER